MRRRLIRRARTGRRVAHAAASCDAKPTSPPDPEVRSRRRQARWAASTPSSAMPASPRRAGWSISTSRPGIASSTSISAPMAARQGRPSASQAVPRRGRHARLDGRGHAAASDRRLQPGQGGADDADRDDGDGMGARRHPRQFRRSGLRAHLDDRSRSTVSPGSRASRQAGAARPCRHAERHRRRGRHPARPAGELHRRPGAAGRWRAHALDPQPRAGVATIPRKAEDRTE